MKASVAKKEVEVPADRLEVRMGRLELSLCFDYIEDHITCVVRDGKEKQSTVLTLEEIVKALLVRCEEKELTYVLRAKARHKKEED